MEAYKELRDQLRLFIDGNQYGAFFINGEWGSGKTTFIQDFISTEQNLKNINYKMDSIKDELNKLQAQHEELLNEITTSSNNDLKKSIEKLDDKISKYKFILKELEVQKDEKTIQIRENKDKIKNGEISDVASVQEKMYIYVSLNGVSRIEDIAHMIFSQIHVIVSKFMNNKGMKIIEKALSGCSFNVSGSVVGFDLDLEKALNSIEYMDYINNAKVERYVIFFDDVERCKIEISELLGFINRFIEEKEIKVVLIGNEIEMANSIYSSERNSHFLGAAFLAGNSNLIKNLSSFKKCRTKVKDNIPKEDGLDDTPFSSDAEQNDLEENFTTIEDIKVKMDEISYKMSIFSSIKDKFISQTYQFNTDYEYVVKEMTKKVTPRTGSISERIIDVINVLRIKNMRVISLAIEKIKNFYKKSELFKNVSNDVLHNVEFCILLATYILNKLDLREAKECYMSFFQRGTIDTEKHSSNYLLLIKVFEPARINFTEYQCINFAFDYVYKESDINLLIGEICNIKTSDNDYEKLCDYWEARFAKISDVTNLFSKVFLKFDKYDIQEKVRIFYKYGQYLYRYSMPEIEGISIDSIFEKICCSIDSCTCIDFEIPFFQMGDIKEIQPKLKEIMNQLKQKKCKLVIGDLYSDLKRKGTIDFQKYSKATHINNGFLSMLDYDEFVKEYFSFDGPTMYRFYELCTFVYYGDEHSYLFGKDKQVLEDFIGELNGCLVNSKMDILVKNNIKTTRDYLKGVLDEIMHFS